MTPYELSLFAEVYIEKEQSMIEEKVTLVWLSECYHRMKKLPPLREELKRLKSNEKIKGMTDEEMYKEAIRLNLQFGGKVES